MRELVLEISLQILIFDLTEYVWTMLVLKNALLLWKKVAHQIIMEIGTYI